MAPFVLLSWAAYLWDKLAEAPWDREFDYGHEIDERIGKRPGLVPQLLVSVFSGQGRPSSNYVAVAANDPQSIPRAEAQCSDQV